jgi:hypothetical protein
MFDLHYDTKDNIFKKSKLDEISNQCHDAGVEEDIVEQFLSTKIFDILEKNTNTTSSEVEPIKRTPERPKKTAVITLPLDLNDPKDVS